MMSLKLYILSCVPLSVALAEVEVVRLELWERLAEKWGIGFVGLGLFCALAWWIAKREAKVQEARDDERKELLNRNIELGERMLATHENHQQQIIDLIIKQNESQNETNRVLDDLSKSICRKP